MSDIHEILIPGGPFGMKLLFLSQERAIMRIN